MTAYMKPRKTSFRLNGLKCTTRDQKTQVLEEILKRVRENKKLKAAHLNSVPWSDSVFIFSDPEVKVHHLSDLPCHKEGLIHFQSLSSTLPPFCLGPEKGDHILDMCAAPGGKTLQILAMVGEEGQVFGNDVDSTRIPRLHRNIASLVPPGAMRDRIQVRVADGRRLMIWDNVDEVPIQQRDKTFSRPFDAILLDAPCSGEGIINLSEPTSYRHWSPASVTKCARIQRQLLDNAFHLVKPGGYILYSTCTLSPQENEAIVQGFLDQQSPRVRITDLAISFNGLNLNNFSPGLSEWDGKRLDKDMAKALRVFPTDQYEGFFVCKLQRTL